VVIVDDEPLARRGIAARLETEPDVTIVAQCAGGREAIESIARLEPDLVFLDVQMPGVGGFDVVEAIGVDRMPAIVFVTAFDQHALRAFEAEALDYLLKPIDDERFARTLERARARVADRRVHRDLEPDGRLLVRDRGRVELVEVDRVVWIEARGDYVRLHTIDRKVLIRETMTALCRRLDPDRFLRIHRSTIVNRDRIARVDFRAARVCLVTLDDGTIHRAGRRYRAALARFQS
jgi:two-component system LytT family response regulator